MTSRDVANHYNAIPNKRAEDRRSSKIFHMRNYNNWMKSMLIARFVKRLNNKGISRPSVLDLCCGKGGDLTKWRVSNIKDVVMTDVADVSVQHAQDRYNETIQRMRRERQEPFDAQFIVADAGAELLEDKYEPKERQFDLASCMFALHYQFADERRARTLIRNITEHLRPGGYFIGVIPDPDQIVHMIRSKGQTNEYKNEVVRVTLKTVDVHDPKAQIPLFGAQLHFALDEVVNCPEYLCKFDLLEKMMSEHDMKLVYQKPLNESYKDFIGKRDHERLFKRMNACESFSKKERAGSDGDKKEYPHAYEFFDKHGDQNCIGTLSRSEWEVISLYRAFAFRKVDHSAENPEESEPEISEDEEQPRGQKRRNTDDSDYYERRREQAQRQ